jgi:hypothetical protein
MAARRGRARISVRAGNGWTLEPVAAARGRRRGADEARDAFIDKLAATRRLAVVERYEATLPLRRGVAEQPLVLDVEARDPGAYVVATRHASGAVTFSFAERMPARRAARGARGRKSVLRFRIQTHSTRAASARRGVGTKVLRIVLMKVVGRFVDQALVRLARAWEQRTWKKKGLAQGLHRVVPGAAALRLAPVPDADVLSGGRNLLFLHGTFSNFTAAFGELASVRGPTATFFDAVKDVYGDRIRVQHFTVNETPLENAAAADALPPDAGPST